MSPEQEAEIDFLSVQTQLEEEREKQKAMDEWANLIRKDKTNLSLREWLQQHEKMKARQD